MQELGLSSCVLSEDLPSTFCGCLGAELSYSYYPWQKRVLCALEVA